MVFIYLFRHLFILSFFPLSTHVQVKWDQIKAFFSSNNAVRAVELFRSFSTKLAFHCIPTAFQSMTQVAPSSDQLIFHSFRQRRTHEMRDCKVFSISTNSRRGIVGESNGQESRDHKTCNRGQGGEGDKWESSRGGGIIYYGYCAFSSSPIFDFLFSTSNVCPFFSLSCLCFSSSLIIFTL